MGYKVHILASSQVGGCCNVFTYNIDLMPSINDFLVVVIIPFMEYVVYPHLERTMNIKIQALHKVWCAALAPVQHQPQAFLSPSTWCYFFTYLH